MASLKSNLLDLDIDRLFEERGVDDIIEIGKVLDAEIEKKHNALRTMVGDRYKDVLVASDAIKCMKTTSQEIVDHIDKIMNTCELFVINPETSVANKNNSINREKIEERAVIAQIRLTMFLNDQIWIALENGNNLDATENYLLAQHIHTGLSLKTEYIARLPLLQQVKANLATLRAQISKTIKEKLETVEITAQELTENLSALMLLDNQHINELLLVYMEHRKTALNTVINTQYPSVRTNISSMVKCLITTISLLHNCFIDMQNGSRGLIWQQIQDIISDSSPSTLSKLRLPVSPLFYYVPELIKQFRPKFSISNDETLAMKDVDKLVKTWLEQTQNIVDEGLRHTLPLISNIKGLHYAREESIRLALPEHWESICTESNLPKNFTVWSYFFQRAITARCKELISSKVSEKFQMLQKSVKDLLEKANISEADLRWYLWSEEPNDLHKFENNHKGISMKTKGLSKEIGELCESIDNNYLELLQDISQYLYGEEYNSKDVFKAILSTSKYENKLIDKKEIEHHLRSECINNACQITEFVHKVLAEKDENSVTKSIICARILNGMIQLCSYFEKCCTLNNSVDSWIKICDTFNKTGCILWQTWVLDVVEQTRIECKELEKISACGMLKVLARWDEIEIQEQTDDKVFTSVIRVPLKPNIILNGILSNLNHKLSFVLPHTLPKTVHTHYIEQNMSVILEEYKILADCKLNQKQALQYLFDVKFVTMFFIPRENVQLKNTSHDICDKLRNQIDPFDLDVFYSYLQNNVKKAVLQSKIILGCLLPSSIHLANLGQVEKSKERDQNPSILAMTTTSANFWFPLLPVSAPSQKISAPPSTVKAVKDNTTKPNVKVTTRKTDPATAMKQSAAALFGGLTTDWFS